MVAGGTGDDSGGGMLADGSGSRWDPLLGESVAGVRTNAWRTCGPATVNLKCDMAKCKPSTSVYATAGGCGSSRIAQHVFQHI